jgi:hypothetical protein
MTKTSEEILELADEIEKILTENRTPGPNQAAISRLTFAVRHLNAIGGYVSEKASRILFMAERFYSPRKHTKYPGGAAALYAEMKSDLLSRIRGHAEYLKSEGK